MSANGTIFHDEAILTIQREHNENLPTGAISLARARNSNWRPACGSAWQWIQSGPTGSAWQWIQSLPTRRNVMPAAVRATFQLSPEMK